jgi:hypothetical protein
MHNNRFCALAGDGWSRCRLRVWVSGWARWRATGLPSRSAMVAMRSPHGMSAGLFRTFTASARNHATTLSTSSTSTYISKPRPASQPETVLLAWPFCGGHCQLRAAPPQRPRRGRACLLAARRQACADHRSSSCPCGQRREWLAVTSEKCVDGTFCRSQVAKLARLPRFCFGEFR